MKLFNADCEVRVGDVVRYGRKPVIVEGFGVDPHLQTIVVNVVTMNERKNFIKLLPYQLGLVVEVPDATT